MLGKCPKTSKEEADRVQASRASGPQGQKVTRAGGTREVGVLGKADQRVWWGLGKRG